jgi:uncharacterized protein (TIGR02996 family)
MGKASKGLERAQRHLAAGELSEAVEALLAAWRRQPSAVIAQAIEVVGASAILAQGLNTPTGKTPKARTEAWAEAAKSGDAVMRGVLIASVAETKGNAETLARLELLLAGPTDPRIATKVGDMIEVPIYNASVSRTNAFWKRLFGLLPELGDPRILGRARTWERIWKINPSLSELEKEALEKRWRKSIPLLETAYRDEHRLDAADEALCASLLSSTPTAATAKAKATATTDADFLAAVYADPADDAVRLVYADFLSERGDPRGELINLQISRGKKGRPSPREKELIAEYQTRWLGPLASQVVKKGVRFERGFVSACTLRLQLPDDDPAWATVEELDGGLPPSDECRMPLLRIARNVKSGALKRFGTRTTPLPRLESLTYSLDEEWLADPKDEKAAVNAFKGLAPTILPALRHLEVAARRASGAKPSSFAWTWASPCCARIESLVLPAPLEQLDRWLKELAKTKIARIELWGETTIEDWPDAWPDSAWRIILTRDDAGELTCLEVRASAGEPKAKPSGKEPLAGIATLPADALTRVHAVVPKPLVTAFKNALKRQKCLESLTFG